jgi:hypothetical protein
MINSVDYSTFSGDIKEFSLVTSLGKLGVVANIRKIITFQNTNYHHGLSLKSFPLLFSLLDQALTSHLKTNFC